MKLQKILWVIIFILGTLARCLLVFIEELLSLPMTLITRV
jgi:hypothetical protein